MKQVVSVIIPAFNAEEWIGDCIESALAQSWGRKEIIVVDDGSKDSTYKIAKSYVSPTVKVVTGENHGASAARNQGLSLAQGDYIQWLDADDVLDRNKIAVQMEQAEAGQYSTILLSGSWGKFYYDPQKAAIGDDQLCENLQPIEWMTKKLLHNLWMPPMAFLISRRLCELAGLWNEKLNLDDDGEYFCRVIPNASQVRFVSEAISYKRITFGLSHDLKLNNKKLDSLAYSIFANINAVTAMQDSDKTKEACLVYLKRWAIYFYPERLDIFRRMQQIARDLGDRLEIPTLRRKYQWIQKLLGWRIAKRAQFAVPALRCVAAKRLERSRLRSFIGHNRIDK